MQVLGKIKYRRLAASALRSLLLTLFVSVVLGAQAQTTPPAVLYSTGAPVLAQTCVPRIIGSGEDCSTAGITLGTAASIADRSLTARVAVPLLTGVSRVRLQLSGTATGGYRAGMLVTSNGSALSVQALGSVTLRTYRSTSTTPATALDVQTIAVSAAQLQLLARSGQPMQLEMPTTAGNDFDQVEIEFGAALSVGASVSIRYAYGARVNQARTVAGFVSRRADGSEVKSGCAAAAIQNAAFASDTNLNNYATIGTIATVSCPAQLLVKLDGTAPGTYQAGFVIGSGNNLLDVGLLRSGLVLRTHDDAGNELQSSSLTSLLNVRLLPDGRSLVSFQPTQSFSSVSIERTGVVTALDNLQIYYGLGVAATTVTPRVLSNFADGSNYYQTTQNGVVCVSLTGCGVTSPANAAGSNNNAAATISTTVGVGSSTTLRLDLNGAGANVTDPPGRAGNRAGVVIGSSTIASVDLVNSATITTYDAAGNVLETAQGSSLLALTALPDGRRTLSFNTTQDFYKVGITFTNLVSALSSTDVYYAFADDSNGQLSITNPGPLPVTLTSFAVRRQSGGATLNWATASEINSARFVVERSGNPATGFRAVGEVAAAGNASTPRTYALQDPEAASLPGILYYRLRQLDLDGSAHLSAVVVLAARPASATFALYPNPATAATRQVTLDGTVAAGYSVSLYTSMGQLLSTRVVSTEAITQPLTLATTGLAAGIYQVVLRDAAGQLLTTQRLLVASY